MMNKNDYLCRYNTHNYLKNYEFVKIVNAKDIVKEYANFKTYPNGTVIAFIDDPFASTCKSSYNYNNFLDLENISFCIAENWNDKDHKKLKRWPIGLESKMVVNKKDLLEKPLLKVYSKVPKIMCNAHFLLHTNPASGHRDDRSNMLNELKGSNKVDFWKNRLSQEETFTETQKYNYSLCPEGNGLDTHRFYETYFLNLKPVVRKGPLAPLHSQFKNTVIVNDWKDAENIDLDKKTDSNNLEMVTLSYWSYKCFREKCRIVTFITAGYCEEWINFLYTVNKQGLDDLVIVFVLDSESLEFVEKYKSIYKFEVRTTFVNSNTAKSSNFNTKEFNNIMYYKIKSVLEILNENYIVFYFDTDVVILKDPIKYYFTLPFKNIYFQSDLSDFNDKVPFYCAGIMFIQPSKYIIDVFNRVLSDAIIKTNLNDQEIINQYIKNNILDSKKIGTLDLAEFPNGARYFQYRDLCSKEPYLIHNNYIVGIEAKTKRFKQHGLWFV
jgi:hypothetical protein